MKLPELPTPAMTFADNGDSIRCYNETQFIEHGIKCAEAMREACVQECIKAGNSSAVGYCGEGSWEIADRVGALEIET